MNNFSNDLSLAALEVPAAWLLQFPKRLEPSKRIIDARGELEPSPNCCCNRPEPTANMTP